MPNPLTQLSNPDVFVRWTKPWIPITGMGALLCLVIGGGIGLFFSPEDVRQGQSVRIMYVHVPAAWLALQTYAFIAGASLVSFIWRHRLADIAAREAAPVGLVFAVLAIVTGGLWGKVTWGVFWDWDPRMTSVLVLVFLYLGYIALWQLIENEWTAARSAGLLAMLGAVNLPIIKFSVEWWDSLHQSPSIRLADEDRCLADRLSEPGADPETIAAYCADQGIVESTIPASMLVPLLVMAMGYTLLFAFVVLTRTHTALFSKRKQIQPKVSTAVLEEAPAS